MSEQDPQYYDFRRMLEESKKLEQPGIPELLKLMKLGDAVTNQDADEVYQRWRTYELQKQCDAGNMARRFDVLDKLKARYAQSIGCDGGPTVDVLTRAAIEEIEWLREKVLDLKTELCSKGNGYGF